MLFSVFSPQRLLGKRLKTLAAGGWGCDVTRRRGMDVLVDLETDADCEPADAVTPNDTVPALRTAETRQKTSSSDDDAADHQGHRGQLIVDVTCAPADIRYPTDVSLLNEAREKTEELIDAFHPQILVKNPYRRTLSPGAL